MDKQELAKASEKTQQVKQREENVKEGAKEAVGDIKQGAKDLAKKTENMDIKDIPQVLPSAQKIDHKLEAAQDKIEDAKTAQIGEKNLANYSKIQQVMKDTQRILGDNRELLKEKTQDGTFAETTQDLANAGQLLKDEAFKSMGALWSNWAALLAVIAGSGAGSWKQMIQESGSLIGQLKHTEDFTRLLNDLQLAASNIAARASKKIPSGEMIQELATEWEGQRDQLMADFQKVWQVLNESPLWRQFVAKGKALGNKASDVAGETKDEAKSVADKLSNTAEFKKLKEDFKNVFQVVVGTDGPSVQPFLDYCADAYDEILNNNDFAKLASELAENFENADKAPKSQAEYEERYNKMYDDIKELLDNTVNNRSLRMALRESKKLMRAVKKDPAMRKLLEDGGKLLAHVTDKKGVSIMDPELLNEIRALIVPVLVDHFDNAPLPDYHGHDSNALGKYDYKLSEIRMGTTGLIPSKVKIEFRYKAEANPEKLKIKNQQMFMYLEASDMQVSFKDVKWEYHRNTIPRFSDAGKIDLCTAGKGITLKLKAELHDYEAPTHASSLSELLSEPKERKMFSVVRAECLIDDFHVNIHDAGAANPFYEMLAGVWGTKIKHQIEQMVEVKMDILSNKFNTQIYDVVKRATQPSLAEETKGALLSAGEKAGAKIQEGVAEAKKTLQSM